MNRRGPGEPMTLPVPRREPVHLRTVALPDQSWPIDPTTRVYASRERDGAIRVETIVGDQLHGARWWCRGCEVCTRRRLGFDEPFADEGPYLVTLERRAVADLLGDPWLGLPARGVDGRVGLEDRVPSPKAVDLRLWTRGS